MLAAVALTVEQLIGFAEAPASDPQEAAGVKPLVRAKAKTASRALGDILQQGARPASEISHLLIPSGLIKPWLVLTKSYGGYSIIFVFFQFW